MRHNLKTIRVALFSAALAAAGFAPAARGDDFGFDFHYDTDSPPPAQVMPAPAEPAPVYSAEPAPVDPAAATYDPSTPAIDVNTFYTDLTPYGRWVYMADYGRVWLPAGVAAGWQPYTLGHWAWTDYGWTWVSDEPFGWATYHYGRWVLAPGYGWVWVPGSTWAPAWVTWRTGDGFIGWAPLPPRVGFHHGLAITSLGVDIGPACFSFVSERSFCEPHLHHLLLPRERNLAIIHNTTLITDMRVEGHHVVNRGIDVARIERATGRHIERVAVREVARPGEIRQARPNEIEVYRPHVTRPAPAAAPTVRPAPAIRPAPAPVRTAPTPSVRPAPSVRYAPSPVPTPSVRPAPAPVRTAPTPSVRPAPSVRYAPSPVPTPSVRSAPAPIRTTPAPAIRPAPAPAIRPAPTPTFRTAPAPTAARTYSAPTFSRQSQPQPRATLSSPRTLAPTQQLASRPEPRFTPTPSFTRSAEPRVSQPRASADLTTRGPAPSSTSKASRTTPRGR